VDPCISRCDRYSDPYPVVAWTPPHLEDHPITPNGTQTLTPSRAREEHLLTVNGTLIEGSPINYLRSEQFVPKTNQLKIVLKLRANQQINATIEVARIVGFMIFESREGRARHAYLASIQRRQ